ncbi:MAG: type VI secretion system protein TssA [Burkholderiaceae bacterium]|nr:type VI secretion system protein TssA [Burkholderiaceae bacterium]
MSRPPEASFSPDLALLLTPLPGSEPSGESLRYAPAYAQIRDARFEEDQNLPMGEWTRPLKKADWKAMEALCTEVLSKSSKDLQVAGWLTEAWTRRYGLDGLLAGAKLLEGLCRDFWDDVHPQAEDGDIDIRIAPFFWANDTFAQALLLHVPLIPLLDTISPYLSLNDWQRASAAEFAAGASRNSKEEGAATRQELFKQALGHIPQLVRLDEAAKQAMDAWSTLTQWLDDQLGNESPSLSKVTENLHQIRLAVRSLLQHQDPREAEKALPPATTDPEPADFYAQTAAPENDAMQTLNSLAASPMADAPQALTAIPTKVTTRAEAYRLLELAAAFLEQTEPHSPTPYLIKRAITWGRLPLPELMQEVIQEEGDISRYFSLLGIKSH